MKISIYSRAFAYMLLVAVIFCGCKTEHKTEQESNWQGFEVMIIDSCEYLNRYEGGQGYRFTHKGNCKFCVKRSKK